MEMCPRCGNSGDCNICDGFGYEFAGDGEGCPTCSHTGDCPTCATVSRLVPAPALLLAHIEN